MARDACLTYRDTDERGHEVYCLVCLKYKGSDGLVVITVYLRLGITRKSIGRPLVTKGHIQALDEEQKEVTRNERRRHVGMAFARTALQTLREGNNYLQYESTLLSLHLAGNDIGSMNHSRRFIRGFVDNMIKVMDIMISEHNLRPPDPPFFRGICALRTPSFGYIPGAGSDTNKKAWRGGNTICARQLRWSTTK
jgi:hypothetical protein